MFTKSENNLLNSSLLHMSSPHGELDPLVAEIGWWVWGTPANFNGFRILASLLHIVAQWSTKLCTMFGCLLGWYAIYIYTFSGALAPNGILPGAKIFAIWSAFNRVRHLYSAGRPSHSASAHTLVDLGMFVVNGICVKLYIAVISLLCHILALRLLFLFSWTEIVWRICLSIFQTNYTTWFDVFESFCFFKHQFSLMTFVHCITWTNHYYCCCFSFSWTFLMLFKVLLCHSRFPKLQAWRMLELCLHTMNIITLLLHGWKDS